MWIMLLRPIKFDKSGPSLNAVNVLVHSKDSFDFTADVLSKLNADQKKK